MSRRRPIARKKFPLFFGENLRRNEVTLRQVLAPAVNVSVVLRKGVVAVVGVTAAYYTSPSAPVERSSDRLFQDGLVKGIPVVEIVQVYRVFGAAVVGDAAGPGMP